ncbi:hypothetical protein H0G86_009655 [Trichoderma simmonsii]|uniref:Uncharacterized protein n=1 Tax=Trichoderma simmonsii TaxID=1491479 RepID=A0A8G0PHE8_9HYPO|nr:hypothetical protein H0G86_009655 [Trichoderma simmonsii]
MSTMLPEWAAHRARGMMVIMLLLGAAFAVGHHFFYRSLSGKPPPSIIYFGGFAGGLTGQQVNLAVGSAFAFSVNSALGAAITTAADQAFWTAIRTKSSRLEVVDNLPTATTNVWSIFDFRLWKKSLTRMVLATIFWLLCVTSFITPATLNVGWSVVKSKSIARVPQVDFTSLNFANIEGEGDLTPTFVYSNPQYPVLQAVAGSTTGGQILPISSPHQNATWLLEFDGPALSCQEIDKESALYEDFTNNILITMVAGGKSGTYYPCMRSFGYISWVPTADIDTGVISPLPFPHPPWIAPPLPGMARGDMQGCADTINGSVSFLRSALDQIANMTITRCITYNTSYLANFTYINGIQSVELATKGSFNNVTGLSFVRGAGPFEKRGIGSRSPIYNIHAIETFAYQAVMDAFGRMFVGVIAYEYPPGNEDRKPAHTNDTQMMLTPLLGTADYSFLQSLDMGSSVGGIGSLLESVEDGGTPWNGYSVLQTLNSTLPVASVIEELFRNATISLMSMPLLRPNYSSPYAPPDVAMTLTAYSIIYSYAARTLWLAYGIAIGMTLLSILLGFVSIYYNDGFSYMTKFSTILRIAYCIDLSEPVRPEDTDGKDPTPRYIGNLTISFPPTGKTGRYEKAAVVSEEEQL